jgi:uncharacterized protein YcsI (UPF0317 family)
MSPLGFDDLQDLGPAALRAVFRTGRYDGPTTGFAPGKLQCNLVILPEASARSFVTYCERNPAPCPLVSVGETGNPNLEPLGQDIDVRTDLPAYHLHRQDGTRHRLLEITQLWQADTVAILLGCSLSFEKALVRAGIRLRHLERGGDPSGRFFWRASRRFHARHRRQRRRPRARDHVAISPCPWRAT